MGIIKCKMCGGDVVATAGMTCGTCEHCGSAMTLPRVADERRAKLFNRANHFRRLNEFDKAVAAYESILNEDGTDAEAHWGVVLSRFGIEYVEDPVSRERVPTCHRVQEDSILGDADYLQTLEQAPDAGTRELYRKQAVAIGEIQKGILALSAAEEAYDVFICYKETSDGGSRTRDSVLAQDIYHQLVEEKYRVFFSRISLENRLGEAYEPCIFAALNSAKVMVVIGTKSEHFGAVWVRNEWSRFMALRKKDSRKVLIPCYQEMNAYDLPDELKPLQSQDMGKLGFLQDLVRGIKKVLEVEKLVVGGSGSVGGVAGSEVIALVKRAMLFLESQDLNRASEYAERALDKDPECAEAYLVQMMAELKMRTEVELGNGTEDLKGNAKYQMALRFAGSGLKQRLEGYNRKRREAAEKIYAERAEANRVKQLELERQSAKEKAEKERLQAADRAEREQQSRELERAEAYLGRGDLDSAEAILVSMKRGVVRVDCGKIGSELTELRLEMDTVVEVVKSTIERLESLGKRAEGFSVFPKIVVREQCRLGYDEAKESLASLRKKAERYVGSEWSAKIVLVGQRLERAIGEFEVGAVLGLGQQVRVMSLVWLGIILSLGTIGSVVSVQRERESQRVAAEAKVKADAEEKEQARLAEVAEKEQLRQVAEAKGRLTSGTLRGGEELKFPSKSCVVAVHWIPAGKFTMGSSDSEGNRGGYEVQTAVVISRGFLMAETECTQAQWQAVMGNNPSKFKGENLPVEQVNWAEANSFCVKLTELHREEGLLPEGYEWRLPTEAEWEYAARAGTTGAYAGELGSMGWYGDNSGGKTHAVKGKQANGWGLYDMHGNVWEWCSDWYGAYPSGSVTDPTGATSGSIRVHRGGSWIFEAGYCRSAYRLGLEPGYRFNSLGFRSVLSSSR